MIPPAINHAPGPRSFSGGLWGVPVSQLHELYWAGEHVVVVRQGAALPPAANRGPYLLLPAHQGLLLQPQVIAELLQALSLHPVLRVQIAQDVPGFRERVDIDGRGMVVRLRRSYRLPRGRHAVLMTVDRDAAELWRTAADAWVGYRLLFKRFPRDGAHRMEVSGVALARLDEHIEEVCDWLAGHARGPLAAGTFPRVFAPGIWAGAGTDISAKAQLVGPIWIGDDCQIRAEAVIVGPKTVLDGSIIDGPLVAAEPHADWQSEGERREAAPLGRTPVNAYLSGPIKRLLDVVVSLLAIVVAAPIYPLIMAAIWLEDGRPIFFAHRRETRGGREFPCVKFRTMRKNADGLAASLKDANRADGPQFYIPDDPRVTRVGRFLRKLHLDETPQFFNVLAGHMSVVGPRPSPHRENQFCPEWRAARLSVRPGITGLWQMLRTRVAQRDFQEWISYDVQYVQHASLALDLWLMMMTALRLVLIKLTYMPRFMGIRPLVVDPLPPSALNVVPGPLV